MTSQLMNHEEAISRLAAERYLLGEMQEQERAAFEEHYLNCAQCLEDVSFGDEFMRAAQPVACELARAEARGQASERKRESAGFFGWLRAGLRSPAPAWAIAVLVLACFSSLSVYQATVVQKQKNVIAGLKAPKQELRFVISGPARAERGTTRVIEVRRDRQLNIRFEFHPGQYTDYRTEISSSDGGMKWVVPMAVAGESSVTVSLPAEALKQGKYSAVLLGQSPNGKQDELASDSFELRFVD